MKASELRSLSTEELETRLSELQEEQLRQRCSKVLSQLTNFRLLRQGRRDIARIKTILNEKQRQAEGVA